MDEVTADSDATVLSKWKLGNELGASLALVVTDCLSELVARASPCRCEGSAAPSGCKGTGAKASRPIWGQRKATEVGGAVNGRRMGEDGVGGVSRGQFLRTMAKKFNCMLIKWLCLLTFSPVDPPYSLWSPSQCLCWILFPVSRYWNTLISVLGPLFWCPYFDDLICSYLFSWCHRIYPDDTCVYSQTRPLPELRLI